jgi:hypothetical protein
MRLVAILAALLMAAPANTAFSQQAHAGQRDRTVQTSSNRRVASLGSTFPQSVRTGRSSGSILRGFALTGGAFRLEPALAAMEIMHWNRKQG